MSEVETSDDDLELVDVVRKEPRDVIKSESLRPRQCCRLLHRLMDERVQQARL